MKKFEIKQLTLEEAESELAQTEKQLEKWSAAEPSYFATEFVKTLKKSREYDKAIAEEAKKEGTAYCQYVWDAKGNQCYCVLLPKEIAEYLIK